MFILSFLNLFQFFFVFIALYLYLKSCFRDMFYNSGGTTKAESSNWHRIFFELLLHSSTVLKGIMYAIKRNDPRLISSLASIKGTPNILNLTKKVFNLEIIFLILFLFFYFLQNYLFVLAASLGNIEAARALLKLFPDIRVDSHLVCSRIS